VKKQIRWGILGCGNIAAKFAHDLNLVEHAELVAVASRSKERAYQFAQSFNVSTHYGDYKQLVSDENVDIVYVATIHPEHADATILCLEHHKHVLCEKPFAMNEAQALKMVNTARDNGCFLMEAMWTRFLPATIAGLEIIASGKLGEVQVIQADFGFLANRDKNGRLFNKQLGGGALLDIGIYPVFLSQLLMGKPTAITAKATFSNTGVDETIAIILTHQTGAISSLHATLNSNTAVEAHIHGSAATLKFHRRFHQTENISVIEGEEVTQHHFPLQGHGYTHEIQHVNRCIQQNLLESDMWSLQSTLTLMNTLDRIRDEINLTY